MKIGILALLLSFNVFATEKVNDVIKFSGDDFFAINSEYNEDLGNRFIEKVLTHQGDKLYIYFDSPGGNIFPMLRMIETMRVETHIKFICVARMAASAAFMTFQHCNERYLLPDGVLMAHNAAGGFQGEFPRIRSLLNVVEGLLEPVERRVAKKLNLSFREYKEAINNNFWVNSLTAKKLNAADRIIRGVSCTKELTETTVKSTETVRSMFGEKTVEKTKSACPIFDKVQ
jgi:ATP-dependent protease ClpP protease subunit